MGASRSLWEEDVCTLRSMNFRRDPDARWSFRQAFWVTGICDDWYGSTMGAVMKSLEAPGTVAQPMRESQTNPERYWVHMDIHSTDCRRYLRFSRCTRAIRIPSKYDAWIIVHYQLLNHSVVRSIPLTFYCLHRYNKEEPKKMASDWKSEVGKTVTITRLSDWNDINRTWSQCHPLNFPSHQGEQSRNTLFINGANQLEVILVFPNDSGLACWWNWIPRLFGLICDI
jgi:hypothetical protein